MSFFAKLAAIIITDAASLTYRDIVRRKLVTPFVVFITFVLSFTASRLVAYAFPSVNLIIGKYHIHHFYYGLALLALAGWIALITDKQRPKLFAAALFGIGLGILADEVGLLLTCTSPSLLECDYYARVTVDVFTIMAGIFLSVLYFLPVFRGFRKVAGRAARFLLFFME